MKSTLRSMVVGAMMLLGCSKASAGFINEFHYDNTGGDTGEFVEIVIASSDSISDFSIALYNGSNGTIYDSFTFGSTAESSIDGFSFFSVLTPGIQNGAPDGIALLNSGSVVEFLSYEGTFTATEGAAAGQTSVDVGVQEISSTPVGFSLQRTGLLGSEAGDFTWSGPSAASRGSINAGQSFTAVPEPSSLAFAALAGAGGVLRFRRRRKIQMTS